MKKALICFLSMLLLCGCKANRTPPAIDTPPASDKAVTFINGVTDADVWILPDTDANRKTSVWGTATASGVKTDESRQTVYESGQIGADRIVVIRTDHDQRVAVQDRRIYLLRDHSSVEAAGFFAQMQAGLIFTSPAVIDLSVMQ